ncbi:hypothetical protein [Methylomonas sp. MgM2]
MPFKPLLSAMAIALTIVALLPYIRAILRGAVQAHVFSWVIWGSTTFVVFLAQLADRGGVGAWPIGVSGSLTILIAFLAFRRRGDLTITRSDWGFFAAALSALPLGYLTSDPFWAVTVLTVVDVLGFGPILRKVYAQPYSESPGFFGLFALRNVLVVLALEHYSPTTLLFPVTIAAACVLVMALIAVRRRAVTA